MPLLIGSETPQSTGIGANYLYSCKFTAGQGGTLEEIWVYSVGTGGVKAGIREDNAGSPGDLSDVNNTGTTCTGGQWNSITLSGAVQIEQGTDYWLDILSNVSNAVTSSTTPGQGTIRYEALSYSSGIPSSPPTWDGSLTYLCAVNGYGIIASTDRRGAKAPFGF